TDAVGGPAGCRDARSCSGGDGDNAGVVGSAGKRDHADPATLGGDARASARAGADNSGAVRRATGTADAGRTRRASAGAEYAGSGSPTLATHPDGGSHATGPEHTCATQAAGPVDAVAGLRTTQAPEAGTGPRPRATHTVTGGPAAGSFHTGSLRRAARAD